MKMHFQSKEWTPSKPRLMV